MSLFSKTVLLFFYMLPYISYSQMLQNGHYKGTESITVESDKTYWPGIYKSDNLKDSVNERWYHEVSIAVNNSLVTIIKRPFTIKDGLVSLSDSTGGFYYYSGNIIQNNFDGFKIFISGQLDSCKFCPKMATAVPLYTYLRYYNIRLKDKSLIMDTDFEKDLIFKKE